MVPLSLKEIRRQGSVMEFYTCMQPQSICDLLFEEFVDQGVTSIKIKRAKNGRDLHLYVDYVFGDLNLEEHIFLTPFDAFGSPEFAYQFKEFMRKYFARKFGSEYTNICKQYDRLKEKNKWKTVSEERIHALEDWDKF